jgi:hypothetical protein
MRYIDEIDEIEDIDRRDGWGRWDKWDGPASTAIFTSFINWSHLKSRDRERE